MGWAAALGVLAGAMLVFPGEAAEAATEGLIVWARHVAPVLGPFMVCMLMITSRVGGGMPLLAGLSWLCGSPGGARLMQPLKLRGTAALRAAALTGTMSPLFFLGTVSAWLQSPAAGRWILLCHWAGALILGLLIPGSDVERPAVPSPLPLSQALRETALALLAVGLCMALGSVSIRMAGCAWPELPPAAAAALQCSLEVTNGVKSLIALRSPWTLPLVCAACSFGGLSLLMQNAAFWQESGVTMGQLCLLRVLHGLLAGGIGMVIGPLTGMIRLP